MIKIADKVEKKKKNKKKKKDHPSSLCDIVMVENMKSDQKVIFYSQVYHFYSIT